MKFEGRKEDIVQIHDLMFVWGRGWPKVYSKWNFGGGVGHWLPHSTMTRFVGLVVVDGMFQGWIIHSISGGGYLTNKGGSLWRRGNKEQQLEKVGIQLCRSFAWFKSATVNGNNLKATGCQVQLAEHAKRRRVISEMIKIAFFRCLLSNISCNCEIVEDDTLPNKRIRGLKFFVSFEQLSGTRLAISRSFQLEKKVKWQYLFASLGDH